MQKQILSDTTIQPPVTYKRRHFDTFDAMRFFAFALVFFQHLPDLDIPGFEILTHGGGWAVKFFFSLSGFLITYLILEEKKQTGKLNLWNFYMRRILRIWPLYFLMVLFAYCTPFILSILHLPSSNQGYEPNWPMSFLFLENYKIIIENDIANVSPLPVMWSLCVEEHFYLIWGIALYLIKPKRVLLLILICICFACISRAVFISNGWRCMDICTNIDSFAFGAIPAYLLISKGQNFENKILSIKPAIQGMVALFTFFCIIILYFLNSPERYLIELLAASFLGFLFSWVIAFVSPQNPDLRIGKKNIFSKLGKYTYGLYMYHTILIMLCIRLLNIHEPASKGFFFSLFFLVLTLLGTIVVSIISYYVFEEKFLRMKKLFLPK